MTLKAVESGPRKIESLAERVKRMQEEARSLALNETGSILRRAIDLAVEASELADAKVLPEGIAYELRALGRDILQRDTTISGIRSKL